MRDEPLSPAAVRLIERDGRGGALRVSGRSMEPTLHDGQLVAVEFTRDRVRFGDLIVFRQADYLAVHRLLGRRVRDGAVGLRTRGDGRPGLDPPLAAEDVVGRVIAVGGGEGWSDHRSPAARAYAVALGLHDLGWAALASLARPLGGERAVAALDRRLLYLVHRLLHRACHPRLAAPPAVAARARDGSAEGPEV